MADVNEIVYLCAAANTSRLKRAAVNGCVGPDFDVVFDYQLSDLGELFVPSSSGIADVSEAVAAENRAGVDDHAIANASAGINRDIGMNCAVIADCRSLADDATGADPGAFPDNHVFVHDRVSVNCDAFAEIGGWMHHRGWMDSSGRSVMSVQKPRRSGKCQPGICRDQQRL